MIERILLPVHDSAGSLAAARVAIDLAVELKARLRVVHVVRDHLLDAAVEAASGHSEAEMRRARTDAAMLTRVAELAMAAGVTVDTDLISGEVGPTVLDIARDWPADLVVIGKSSGTWPGQPYVGAETRHVLEFADQPVLVVPHPRP